MAKKKEKTPPPISAEEFFQHAKPLKIRIQQCDEKGEVLSEQIIVAFPKKNSSGSYGWHASEKPVFAVNAKDLKVQMNCGLTIIGTKPGETES